MSNPILNLHRDVDSFTRAYITCALWSTNDESTPAGGEPLDQNFSWTDLANETLQKMIADCTKFQRENAELLKLAGGSERNGHDFWLTRNGHGTGFWDRGYEDEIGDALTLACKKFGEFNLYVGDDGKIYA